jgi:glycosyltransferase involved in cell wall biosynthesis
VIYSGADPIRFSPPSAPRRRSDRLVVAGVGPIGPWKGQLDFIDAAARIRQTMADVEFRICGLATDARFLRECHDRIRARSLEGHVAITGPTDEPWTVYRDADVVVFCGRSGALPAELPEAMLTGRAIVATDVGATEEALGAGGVLVPPRDPLRLAVAITMVLQMPNWRETLGHQARERALAMFTEPRFVDAYRESYALLLRRRVSSPGLADAAAPHLTHEVAIA